MLGTNVYRVLFKQGEKRFYSMPRCGKTRGEVLYEQGDILPGLLLQKESSSGQGYFATLTNPM